MLFSTMTISNQKPHFVCYLPSYITHEWWRYISIHVIYLIIFIFAGIFFYLSLSLPPWFGHFQCCWMNMVYGLRFYGSLFRSTPHLSNDCVSFSFLSFFYVVVVCDSPNVAVVHSSSLHDAPHNTLIKTICLRMQTIIICCAYHVSMQNNNDNL